MSQQYQQQQQQQQQINILSRKANDIDLFFTQISVILKGHTFQMYT